MKSNFSATASSHIGRALMIHAVAHTITSLSDKMGKLKNGQDAPYLVVTAADGKTDMLHPRTAVTLFSKGEAAGIKMLVTSVINTSNLVSTPIVGKAKASAKVAPIAASTSKKAQAVAIFNEVVAANGTRAEVIQRIMAETNSSLNLANTYYQNMRGGKVGW
jgi:hypothetical protein